MPASTADLLLDLVETALEDVGALPIVDRVRFRHRLVELAELEGLVIARSPADQPAGGIANPGDDPQADGSAVTRTVRPMNVNFRKQGA